MKQIAIIHFNTPELTEACILSIRKVGCDWPITVLDNSDKRPFNKRMKLVKVLNNRKQQLIDFDAELKKYPDKCWDMARLSNYGSVKHMMSVQYLWGVLKDGFILVESDVLLAKPFDFLWDENFAACGKAQWFRGRCIEKDRLLPWLCYMNVLLLVKNGAKYYDPSRSWGLQPGGMRNPNNWYDTGAPLLEDIIKTKPQLTARLYPNLDKYYIHYCGGSWRGDDMKAQAEWLKNNEKYWEQVDNSDAKIFVCTHADFKPVVKNEVYEVVDSRSGGDAFKDVPGPFYSELLHMYRVSKRKTLPNYIGFVHYRKYFDFLDAVPSIRKNIEKHGAIIAAPVFLGMPMRDQWGTWGNIEDLDLATEIVNEKYPALLPTWRANLAKKTMHPGSLHVMKREDWLEMVACAWDVANEFLKRIGGNIDKRINENPKKYHIGEMEFTDLLNERRVGGNICERIVSAWIDWKFPNALQVPMVITAQKITPNDVKSKKK
ncbi:MAG: DUF4422 domain-containing protein [Bacteroidaceae bacterium]|nr:DUF4422 domain-containing protein [Bacteroidaceae bacterium]